MTAAEKVSRPYSHKRGGPPSVTTVIDAMGGKHLEWGASKETARYVVEHIDEVGASVLADKEGCYEHLRRHFRGVWDASADVGTALHAVNEAWIAGETVDLADVIPERSVKAGRSDTILARLGGYVDGLERFWNDCKPETIATEYVVRYPSDELGYIGTVDWRARLNVWPEEHVLLDIKTTAEVDPDKAVYLDSWRLQLCAYNRATEVVHYDGRNEIGTEKHEPAKHGAILHLRGEGHYDLIEVDLGDDVWNAFCAVRRVHDWLKTGASKPAPRYVRPELIAMAS